MRMTRRSFLATSAAAVAAGAFAKPLAGAADKAAIAITLDLEMARNFPTWETTHWDYEKGKDGGAGDRRKYPPAHRRDEGSPGHRPRRLPHPRRIRRWADRSSRPAKDADGPGLHLGQQPLSIPSLRRPRQSPDAGRSGQ